MCLACGCNLYLDVFFFNQNYQTLLVVLTITKTGQRMRGKTTKSFTT